MGCLVDVALSVGRDDEVIAAAGQIRRQRKGSAGIVRTAGRQRVRMLHLPQQYAAAGEDRGCGHIDVVVPIGGVGRPGAEIFDGPVDGYRASSRPGDRRGYRGYLKIGEFLVYGERLS